MSNQEYLIEIKTYLYKLEQSLLSNPEMFREIYYDKEGILSLARQIGYALSDFSLKERNGIMGGLYGTFAVKLYNLKPFVDSCKFYKEVEKGLNMAREFKEERGAKYDDN